MHLVDIFIILAYIAICTVIGIFNSRKIQSLKDFALGYREVSNTTLLCTIFASSIGAGASIGTAEKIYLFGLIFCLRQIFRPFCWLISAYLIAPYIHRFKGCLTISEIMYKFYGLPGRLITSIAAIMLGIGSMAIQASAMGYLFKYFFEVELIYGIFLGYIVLTTYSVLGGALAISYTEIFKFVIFFTLIPLSLVISILKTGGFTTLLQALPTSHLTIEFSSANVTLILSFMLYSLLPSTDPELVQRYLSTSDPNKLKSAFKSITVIAIPFALSIAGITYFVKAYAPTIEAKDVIFYYIHQYLPIGCQGLLVVAILAIIMSKAEAKLNATSVIIVNDILNLFFPNLSNYTQVFFVRTLSIFIPISSAIFLFNTNNLLDIFWTVTNFWDPIILVPILAGFLGFKTHPFTFIVSAVYAIVFVLLARIHLGSFSTISYSFGILGSAIGFFGAHFLFKSFAEGVYSNFQFSLLKLKQKALKFGKLVSTELKKHAASGQEKSHEFCLFIFFTFSLYITYLLVTPNPVVIGALLAIGYVLTMALFMQEFIFISKLKIYFEYYWNLVLFFCLPFTSSYILFQSNGDDFWVITGVLSSISLYFFIDAVRYLLYYTIGTILAFALFTYTHSTTHIISFSFSYIGVVYSFILLTTIIFLKNKEELQDEKVEAMRLLGGAIAHEVKSPLATLNMGTQHLKSLLSSATRKDSKKLSTLQFNRETLDSLIDINQSLYEVSSRGVKTIDTLLTSMKTNLHADDKANYKISLLLDLALNEYNNHSQSNSKKHIKLDIQDDYTFYGSLQHMKHVIFNLLDNAKKHGGKDVKIQIICKENKLFFRDNGKGISKEALPHIFDKFYSGNKTGTGIGLSFCKLVIEDIDGDITCHSEEGKYTEFVLKFKRI